MDISTLVILASLLFGAIIGDAVVYGKTMRAEFTLPKSVEAQGFTQDAAENIFISEFARISDIPFILPFPTVAQANKDSLLSVVAKPLKIDPIVELLQDKFGADRVSMKLLMVTSGEEGTLEVKALVSTSGGHSKKLVMKGPDKAPAALIEATARLVAADLLPYRVSLSYYDEGLSGRPERFRDARALARSALQDGFDKTKATQRAMLFNVLGLVAAQEKDLAAADGYWADGMEVPMASGTAKAILAANRAILAVARKDPKAARELYNTAMASKKLPYLDYFDLHLEMIDAIIMWSEGKHAEAEANFLYVERILVGDTAVTYRARLLEHMNRGDEAKLLAKRAAYLKTVRNQHPDLIASVFWVDPVKGGLTPR